MFLHSGFEVNDQSDSLPNNPTAFYLPVVLDQVSLDLLASGLLSPTALND
jgi:hypothetical protein